MKYTRRNVLKSFNKYFYISKKLMMYSALTSLGTMIISLILPYLHKLLVDDVMIGGNIDILHIIIPMMIFIYIIKIIFVAASTYVKNKFANLTKLTVKKQLMKRLLYRDISIKIEDVGTQCTRLEDDSEAVYNFFANFIVQNGISLMMVLIYFFLMMFISPFLSMISMVLIPTMIAFSKAMGKKFNNVNRQLYELTSKTKTHLFTTMQQWSEIKSSVVEDKFCLEYNAKLEQERKINTRWMLQYALNNIIYVIKDQFVMKVLIYFIGGGLIIVQELSIGSLLLFMSYMESMSVSLNALLVSISDFSGQEAVYDRLFAILDEETEKGKSLDFERPSIVFDNVDFSYKDSNKCVFSGINCKFIYGEKYLIIGKSGEGKSTLIKLLLGVVEADHGDILINDTSRSMIDSRCLFKRVGVVMQENTFFNLSILENFQLLAPNASEEDINQALKMACLFDFVESLPQKLNTLIGERGIKLSRGQRQRLALARLILHDPEIIILDEATSALDSIVETEILNNLEKQFGNRTMIVISHKPLMNYCSDYIYNINKRKVDILQN